MLPNEQTLEFSQAKLKAKDCLHFTMRTSGENLWYMIEDEVSGKFFQVGLPQYTFLSMLDGKRTVGSAIMKTASLLREHAIDEREAANICKWAIESGLVETELSSSTSRRAEKATQESMQRSVAWLNPITLKMPLFRPDGAVTEANRLLGWIVSPFGALVWMIVVCYGFFQLFLQWQEFTSNHFAAISSNDFLWFALTWVVLKLIHEFAHSLVCKKFGGRIHNGGILLLLLIPLPYVDVTSSWRFPNKWARILTAAAGMLAEIFLAAIACIVWVSSTPGPLQYHAGNVIIAATLHTLIFNANPLMRFDGYYMLSDWLEIPNLSTHGRQWVKGACKRLYFGNKMTPTVEVGMRALIVKAYGVLAVGWFFLIAFGLGFGASSMLEGFGLMIALAGCLLWFGIPVVKFLMYVIKGTKFETPNRLWFSAAASITVLAVGSFLILCPSPSVVSAPVVVDYEPLFVVRAKSSGFANNIHVEEGQMVSKGQLMMTLDNPELLAEYESLLIDLRISDLRIKSLLMNGDVSAIQIEQESVAAQEKRRDELELRIRNLTIFAPADGRVMAEELSAVQGTYLTEGDEILSVGQPGELLATALIKQQDVEWLESSDAKVVDLCFWGDSETESMTGQITHINPRARDDLPHEAFAASNGGALAVVSRSGVEGSTEEGEDDMMLTEPRVPVEIELDESARDRLLAGQTGLVLVRSRRQNMGSYLAENFMRLARAANFRSHGL